MTTVEEQEAYPYCYGTSNCTAISEARRCVIIIETFCFFKKKNLLSAVVQQRICTVVILGTMLYTTLGNYGRPIHSYASLLSQKTCCVCESQKTAVCCSAFKLCN